MILNMLRKTGEDPSEMVPDLAQSLLTLLVAICEYNDYSSEVCDECIRLLGEMQEKMVEAVNENTTGVKWHTMRELKETIAVKHKPNEEADQNARNNACKTIMDPKNIGFLLVSYMASGNIVMASNLDEGTIQDDVLTAFRETLFGESEPHVRFGDAEKAN